MRILYVSSLSPFPSDNGGRQRTKLIWEALSRLGDVDFVLHSAWPVPPDTIEELTARYALRQYHMVPEPEGTVFAPLLWIHPGLAYRGAQQYARRSVFYAERVRASRAIRGLCESGRYDLVVSRYLRCASRSGLLDYAPLCIDVDDVDWEFFSSSAATPEVGILRRWIFRHQARVLRAMMSRLLKPVDLAWVTKADDAAKIGPVRSRLLPNAVDALGPPAAHAGRHAAPTMLFVGALGWSPNQAGLLRFVREVMPKVNAHFPEVRLQVVGSGAPDRFIQALASCPGVDFVGAVPDVAPYYAHCLFSVIPVDSGAGSHIKIPESLYHGVTCITSVFGHRGYEQILRAGESLLTAADAGQFAEACVSLIRNPELRVQLAEHGLAIVKERYTKPAFFRTIAESVEDLNLRAGAGGMRRRVPTDLTG